MGINNCSFAQADTLVWVNGTGPGYSNIIINACTYGNVYPYNYGFKVSGVNSVIELLTITTAAGVTSAPTVTMLADGATSKIISSNHVSITDLVVPAGIFAQVINGGIIEIISNEIEGYALAISAPVDAGTPEFIITGSDFDSCTMNIDILNTNCIGYMIGYSPRLLTNIVNGSSFFIANSQKNIVTVAAKGADFTTIQGAVAYIIAQGDGGENNPYSITIGPGVYTETVPIDLSDPALSFLMVVGNSIATTIVQPANADDIFITGDSTSIYRMEFRGNGFQTYGSGFAAIKCINQGASAINGYLIHKCQFNDNDIGIYQETTLGGVSTYGYTEICDFNGTFSYGIYLKCNDPSLVAYCSNDILYILPEDLTNPTTGIYITGIGSTINISSGLLNGPDPFIANSVGLEILDGASVEMSSCNVIGFDIGIDNPITANATNINILSCLMRSNNTDINIQNANTTGSFQGQAAFSKIQRITTNSVFSWNFTDIDTGAFEITEIKCYISSWNSYGNRRINFQSRSWFN
jgi:hypothetical protein